MNDNDLIIQLKNRNRDAFAYLMEKYKGLVWGICFRMSGNRAVAEDLYQESFYRVWRDISKFRGESKLSTWIGSIAFHISSDYLRKRKNSRLYMERIGTGQDESTMTTASPNDQLEKAELKALVREVIDMLPPSQRTVITLFYINEFSIREIYQMTGIPEGTIKSFLNRGRNEIKKRLTESFPEYVDERGKKVIHGG